MNASVSKIRLFDYFTAEQGLCMDLFASPLELRLFSVFNLAECQVRENSMQITAEKSNVCIRHFAYLRQRSWVRKQSEKFTVKSPLKRFFAAIDSKISYFSIESIRYRAWRSNICSPLIPCHRSISGELTWEDISSTSTRATSQDPWMSKQTLPVVIVEFDIDGLFVLRAFVR